MDRCPIEDPRGCIMYRCWLTGVCDYNRRKDIEARELREKLRNGQSTVGESK